MIDKKFQFVQKPVFYAFSFVYGHIAIIDYTVLVLVGMFRNFGDYKFKNIKTCLNH